MNKNEFYTDRRNNGVHRRRGFSTFRYKVIGSIFLAFGVASSTLIPLLMGDALSDMAALTTVVIAEVVSWCAIPIFAWLLVEGYRHTHSKVAYGLRLLALAVICEVPYDYVTFGKVFSMESQNPVFALVLALLVLSLVDYARSKGNSLPWVLGSIFVVSGLLWSLILNIGLRQTVMNIGVVTTLFAVVFYLLYKRENTMMITAGVIGAFSFVGPAIGVAFLHYRNEILGYQQPWTKWAWYAVYPAMLLIGTLLMGRI